MATKKSAPSTKGKASAKGKGYEGFSAEERAAMKEHAEELKAAPRRGKADAEAKVLEKIAELPDADRVLAERIHALVKANAPELAPKLWYGMPTYTKNGKNVCFFQAADKFKSRYATLGFDDAANLDDGSLWPTSFAVTKLTAANEKTIIELIKKAVS
ncbi:DUF1801 domain-containing protein [Kribbella sp. NBC_01245]|uniref:iron chaperone n=1 Tax=Kribbella sp. NBC_01245 TaxID=2903578 RepID=UPI002E292F24|nr:DUF1801 domain-containing protein [Kribbella sp. NBC_01245]